MTDIPIPGDLDLLQRVRPVDPSGDELIDHVVKNHDIAGVRELLKGFIDYRHLHEFSHAGLLQKHGDTRTRLHDYLYRDKALPEWADVEKIERATTMIQKYQYTCYLILVCASLPECYLCRDGVKVLHATHRLETDVHRRLLETHDFFVSVMTPGALTSDAAPAIATAKKVRLIHSAIRHLVRETGRHGHKDADHNTTNGLTGDTPPVDQTLMGLTLLTFSYVVLRGLQSFEVAVTDEEKEAYIHTWSVIGHFLGVADPLLPSSYDHSERLFVALKAHQCASTPEGQELERSLLGFTQRILPWYLRTLPRQLTFDLMDEDDCVRLGLELPSGIGRIWVRAPLLVSHVLNLGILQKMRGRADRPVPCEYVSRLLIKRYADSDAYAGRRCFEIPVRLAASGSTN